MFSVSGAFVQVQDALELADALNRLFRNSEEAEELAKKGHTVLTENRGALPRLLALMEPLISKVQEGQDQALR